MRQTTIHHPTKLYREGRWKNPAAPAGRFCRNEQLRRNMPPQGFSRSRGGLLICVSSLDARSERIRIEIRIRIGYWLAHNETIK